MKLLNFKSSNLSSLSKTFKSLNFEFLNPSSDSTASVTTPEDPNGSDRYTHAEPGFSFALPPGFSARAFGDEGGDAVLVEGQSPGESFQIFLTPFDESGPITPERILEDIPGLVVLDPQRATIGGADTLVFFSEDPSLGKLREVWFSQGGYLYQITASAAFDEELSKIMATLSF